MSFSAIKNSEYKSKTESSNIFRIEIIIWQYESKCQKHRLQEMWRLTLDRRTKRIFISGVCLEFTNKNASNFDFEVLPSKRVDLPRFFRWK